MLAYKVTPGCHNRVCLVLVSSSVSYLLTQMLAYTVTIRTVNTEN